MSNEELVAAIQAGEDRMGELWKQIEGLVKWKAKQRMADLEDCGSRGVEFDDLYQSGYLALVDAVESYDPTAGGAFSTWFIFHLKTAFAEATGYRTQRGRNEPLNNYLSLDTPLTDDVDSDDLMDVIADPTGLRWRESLEEAMWRKQLHEAMEKALAEIPPQYSEVLRWRYYDEKSLDELSSELGKSKERIRQKENKGIRLLRKSSIACHLRPFLDFDFYCGTGLGAFRNSGLSIQERYLILEEDRREREEQRRKEQEELERQRDEQWKKEYAEIRERHEKWLAAYLESLSPEAREEIERRLANQEMYHGKLERRSEG